MSRDLSLDSVSDAEIRAFVDRVEADALQRHLHDHDRREAAAEALIGCPACGHDQRDHAPDNLPPYQCTLMGCTCARVPDHLIAEAPLFDDAGEEAVA